MTVDILESSDQYWNLVTGTAKQGKGPTEMYTTLGWVLSDPTDRRIDENQHTNNLVTTHVLRSTVQFPMSLRDGLEGEQSQFCELETLGIQPRSVHVEPVETITKDSRYKVQLPCRSS